MQVEKITWDTARPEEAFVRAARLASADTVLIQSKSAAGSGDLYVTSMDRAELVILRDSAQALRWRGLSQALPAELYLLAVPPELHLGIIISVAAAERSQQVHGCRSLSELTAQIAGEAGVAFVDDVPVELTMEFDTPSLTCAEGAARPTWVQQSIRKLAAKNGAGSTAVTGLKAGLFLINDFFDDSHQASQSIEGQGRWRTGDYWHAILHRREPDYGNAKYWFRHVGAHPVMRELADIAQRRILMAEASLASRLQPWKTRLASGNGWDPFGFVDLCAAADNDPALKAWCEALQYDEMLLLLQSTAEEARELLLLGTG